jgi:hypothetical protein
MKNTLILALGLMLAPAGFCQPRMVELNGLVALGNEKLALLTLKTDGSDGPASFMLAEGQARNGVKLLHVDMTNRRAEVDQAGMRETIVISGQAKLVATVGGGTDGGTNGLNRPVDPAVLAAYLNGDEVDKIKAGAPVVAFFGGAAASGTGTASGNSSGAANGSSTSPGSGQSTAKTADHSNEVWYQESVNIEQARLATAQDVVAGNATPWPRTPLTPASTPAQLIGPETVFGNQIPRWVPPGLVDPLPAK